MAVEREQVRLLTDEVRAPLSIVDRGVELVQWIARRPMIPVLGLAALLVWRRKSLGSWIERGLAFAVLAQRAARLVSACQGPRRSED
jgi:hypothetical protein